jgi:hypothetical protein
MNSKIILSLGAAAFVAVVALGEPAWAATGVQVGVSGKTYATRVAVSPDGSLKLVDWIDHYHGTAQVAQLNGATWNVHATDINEAGTAVLTGYNDSSGNFYTFLLSPNP